MTTDYIPRSDIEFDAWFKRFTAYVVAHYSQLGISPMEKTALVNKNNSWKTRYGSHITAQTAARGEREMKDNERKDDESYARYIAQRATTYSGTTDEARERMGITVPDTTPTPVSSEYVMEIDPPLLKLDLQSGQVTIHFGVNPGDEHKNAKPENIGGAKLWYRVGGGEWQWLGYDTNSPYRHNIELSACGALEYRAQWLDKKMRTGRFSMVAQATVS